MRFPIRIRAFVRKNAVFTLRCPACGQPRRFELIKHGTRLTAWGFPVWRFHRHYNAVCTECGTHYSLSESRVKELLALRKKEYRQSRRKKKK